MIVYGWPARRCLDIPQNSQARHQCPPASWPDDDDEKKAKKNPTDTPAAKASTAARGGRRCRS